MIVQYEPHRCSYRVWVKNENDYKFMQLLANVQFDPYKFLKCYQNSIYGKLVSEMGIDEEENDNMNKDYILIHVDKEPMIIFKKQIVSIAKDEGRAYIQCTTCGYLSEESYANVVKQAL